MKFIIQKYLYANILLLFFLTSCNNTTNLDKNNKYLFSEKEPIKKVEIIDTIVSVNTKDTFIDSSNNIVTTADTVIVTKENRTNVKPKSNHLVMEPDYALITEEEYWKWRKSKYYINDSIKHREGLKSIRLDLDSLEFEKRFETIWNDYINKKEKNNVIWDSK